MKNIIILLLLVFSTSCKKDVIVTPANCSSSWATEVSSEFTGIGIANSTYLNEPTAINCTALKNAYTVYINALTELSNCTLIVGTSKVAFDKALKDAKESIKTIC